MASTPDKRYRIIVKPAAERNLDRMHPEIRERIVLAVHALACDPRPKGCKLLRVERRYRVRVGYYRIVYEIRDDVLLVLVVRIAHRSDAYR
jgi:mRNA interferase RelE/StbE